MGAEAEAGTEGGQRDDGRQPAERVPLQAGLLLRGRGPRGELAGLALLGAAARTLHRGEGGEDMEVGAAG